MSAISEADISRLVALFYTRIRKDPFLSPIFIGKIGDCDAAWEAHSQHIADFWSSIFLKTKRFTGNPMLKHIALPGVTPHHFDHWLSVFEDSAMETLGKDKAATIVEMAHRVAKSLQMGLAYNFEKSGKHNHPFMEFGLLQRQAERMSETES